MPTTRVSLPLGTRTCHPSETAWFRVCGCCLDTLWPSYLVKEAVYSHHERPDGKGYPRGLRAGEVHLDARIVGLCDAFDAMTSSHPYRAGMSRGQALAIIQSQSGSQFDAELSRHFIELGRRGLLDHPAI